MSATWALLLDPDEGEALGPLRRAPGLEVCPTPQALWLRGGELDEASTRRIRALPATARYELDEAGEVRPPGARLPVGRLPAGPWWPLARFLQPRLPAAEAAPAAAPGRVPLRLVTAGPDDPMPEPSLLRLPLEALRAWAEEASALRLARLELAIDPTPPARALVRGAPLPPLPGERLCAREGLAWPVGWALRPRLDPGSLAAALGLLPGELAILTPDGGRELVPGGAFVPATRAAIRGAAAEATEVGGG